MEDNKKNENKKENKFTKFIKKMPNWSKYLSVGLLSTLVATGVSVGVAIGISKNNALPKYTVTFKNDDGSVLATTKVELGKTAKYEGSDPQPNIKEDWTDYTFTGWDKSLDNILYDTEVTAQYSSTKQTYTMVWKDEDGTVLETQSGCLKEEMAQGILPTYPKKLPTKPATQTEQFIFARWKVEEGEGWKTGSYSATATYNSAQPGLTIKDGVVEKFVGSGSVVVPSEWEGVPVTTIASNAFADTETNGKVTSITLPSSVTTLESYAFANCSQLTQVTFTDTTIDTIPSNAFENCTSLESFTFPQSIKTVNNKAFKNCSKLTTISIGKNLVNIDFGAFIGCTKLANVTIDNENNMFHVNEDLPGVIFSGDQGKGYTNKILLRCLPSVTTVDEAKLPAELEIINSLAFQSCEITGLNLQNCTKLKYILNNAFENSKIETFKTGPSVKSFGENVFLNCAQLKTIYFGKSIAVDESTTNSFVGCTSLETIIVDSENQTLASDNGMLYDKTYKKLLRCPTNHDPVDGSKKLQLNASCSEIGSGAFAGSLKLTECIIPAEITTLDDWAFWSCPKLSKITVGTGPTNNLGKELFSESINLKEICIADGLQFSFSLNAEAFSNCKSLEKITLSGTSSSFEVENDVLYGKQGSIKALIKYPAAKQDEYFAIPNNVQFICKTAFDSATKLKTITFPLSITTIFERAFSNCSNLESVQVAPGFTLDQTKVKEDAFKGCDKLENIVFTTLTDDENEIVKSFAVLLNYRSFNIKINTNTSKINDDLFFQNSYIKSVDIQNTMQNSSIGANAFRDCEQLSSIKISKEIKTIGEYAFGDLVSLTTLDLKDTCIETISKNAFLYDTNLISIKLPSTLKTIGTAAFGSLLRLEEINLEETNLETLQAYSFGSCVSLETLKLPATLTSLPKFAFNHCTSLTSVTFAGTIAQFKQITSNAPGDPFMECFSLHEITCSDGTIIV